MNLSPLVVSLACLLDLVTVAAAQEWPTRTIRVVVPFPAGGSADVQTRIIADELQKAVGQNVIVENKPGANGNIGASDVARAAPDGHTLCVGSAGTHATNVSLYSKLQYDPVKDFVPLTLMTNYPQVIVPGTGFRGATLADLIGSLKQSAGRASYGTSGIGSPTHVAAELFKRETGTDVVHVPYRGQGPALNDLVGGRLDIMFPSVPDALSFLRAGKLRALAIMSAARSKVVADVATTAELGYPKLLSAIWVGLYVTAGTPLPVVARLNSELTRIIGSPAFRERVEPLGYDVRPMSVEAFTRFNADETARWGEIIRANNIRVE
jgi:tripartite-type tricarboxylate transporter receptor subunit TctC